MACGPNVALFKKIMALFKSRGAKKRLPKKFGKIGKKVRVDGPQQKKVPNFPIFWPTYHKGLTTPVGCSRGSISHHTSQFDREMGRYCCSEDTSKRRFFKIFVQFVSFFVFPISFIKLFEIVIGVMPNSAASFRTVVRGLALTKALSESLSTSDGRPVRSSSSRFSSTLRNFLNYQCAVRSSVVPWPNALLISRAVSAAFRSSLNWNKKIVRICLLCMLS